MHSGVEDRSGREVGQGPLSAASSLIVIHHHSLACKGPRARERERLVLLQGDLRVLLKHGSDKNV